eukprot:gene20526-biopygen16125
MSGVGAPAITAPTRARARRGSGGTAVTPPDGTKRLTGGMVYPKRRIHLPPEAPLTRLRRFVWRSLIKGTLQRFEGVSDGPALQV